LAIRTLAGYSRYGNIVERIFITERRNSYGRCVMRELIHVRIANVVQADVSGAA